MNLFREGIRVLCMVEHPEKKLFKDFFRSDAVSRLKGPKLEGMEDNNNNNNNNIQTDNENSWVFNSYQQLESILKQAIFHPKV